MQLFLIDGSDGPQATLSPEESRHCIKVLRRQEGDEIFLTDGKGMAWRGKITDANKQATTVSLVEELPDFGEHGHTIRLVFSPLRLRDRLEWMMEKSVELGVTELIPIRTARTDKYKAGIKPERIRTILSTAAKQSFRSRIPVLHSEQSFRDFSTSLTDFSGLNLIARADGKKGINDLYHQILDVQDITLMIGPEGDFTDEEVEIMTESGFTGIHLGHQRLRSETAAIFGLSALKHILGY